MKLNLKIVAAMSAVAMMSTGAAYAATVTATPASANYSLEGLQLQGGEVAIPDISITFGNNLTYQDDLFITVTGATAGTAPLTVNCIGTTVGFVERVGNTWNYRITDQDGATIGEVCTFSGFQVTSASLAASGAANIAFRANRFITGQPLDNGSTSNLAVVRSQFAASAGTELDAVIDVFADRTEFVVGDPSTTEDTLVFTTTVDIGLLPFVGTPYVNATRGTVTIFGDLTWADDDGDGNCAETAGNYFDTAGTLNYVGSASDCTRAVFTTDDPNATTVHTVIVSVPGDVVLSPIDWTGTVVYDYELNGPSTANGMTTRNWDPGEWTINGAQVYINYMPYGDNISRIIYAANEGALDATVEVDAFDDMGNSYSFDAGGVPGGTVTKLSQVIDEGLRTAGFSGTGKVAMRLTFTAPDKDIEVYSAYNVGNSDRGTVVNTSNGRSFFYGITTPTAPPPPPM